MKHNYEIDQIFFLEELEGDLETTDLLVIESEKNTFCISVDDFIKQFAQHTSLPYYMDYHNEFLVGNMELFAGDTQDREGWLLCDGRLLEVSQYPKLFAVIGNRYGGDGVNNFALPKSEYNSFDRVYNLEKEHGNISKASLPTFPTIPSVTFICTGVPTKLDLTDQSIVSSHLDIVFESAPAYGGAMHTGYVGTFHKQSKMFHHYKFNNNVRISPTNDVIPRHRTYIKVIGVDIR